MSRFLRTFAMIWSALVAILVAIVIARVLVTRGFGAVQQVLSPFNFVYVLVVLVILAPAIGARLLADRVDRSRGNGGLLEFDIAKPEDVALIDQIRDAYSRVLGEEGGPYAACMFKPASELPYTKDTIRCALTALLDFTEGRRDSSHIDPVMRSPSARETLRSSLVLLDNFVDVPASQLPTDPSKNARAGSAWLRGRRVPTATPPASGAA